VKVGIAGLGSSGSFLLNLLSKDGFDVTGFDPKKDGYYIPCGYAANYSRMKELIALCGLNFDDYVLST
jgi:phosphoglycerate dehydrogenase-like enzyme